MSMMDEEAAGASAGKAHAGRRLTINTTALIGAQAAVRLASLAVVLLIGRLLGPEGLGLYALAGAVASLAVVPADAGIDTVTIRRMAAGRSAAPYLGALLPLRLGLAALAVAAAGAGVLALGYPAAAAGLAIAYTVGSSLEILAGSLRAALRAAETMVAEAALVVAGQGLRALLVAAALAAGLGLAGIGGAIVLAALGSLALALLVVARRHGLPRPRLDRPLWRATALETAPVAAWLLLIQIGSRSDAIIIGLTWPTAEVGGFHAAAGVLSGLNIAVAMALAALYPPLVRALAGGEERRAWRLAEPILAGGLAVTLVIAILAPLVIDPVLAILLGERFAGAGPPLLILRWALPALVVSGVGGVLLRADRQDHPLAWLALIGAVTSLVLNLLLIPAQGALGAATSTVAAEVAMAAAALGLAWRRFPCGRALAGGGLAGVLAGSLGLAAAGLTAGPWWLTAGGAAAVAGLVLAVLAAAVLALRYPHSAARYAGALRARRGRP